MTRLRSTTCCQIAASQCILDELHRRLRIVRFNDQFVVPLVMQINHDGFLRVVHVPEDSLAVLIEGSRSDDSGHIGSGHPDAVIPAACGLRIGTDACDVDERNFEAALECQSLSAPRTCSISMPSAIDKSTTDRLL